MTTINSVQCRVNEVSVNSNSSANQKAPLGILGSIASPNGEKSSLNSPVVLRFYRQSLARELLSGQAVAFCLRYRQAIRETVDVIKNGGTGRVHYSGLQTCKSIWHCPVCSARISEGRRQELAAALLDAHMVDEDGLITRLYPAMVTYTVQHTKAMACSSSVAGILSAYRRFKSGKGYQMVKDEFGLVGSVRSLEITYGEKNGWHPHIHELMLFSRQLTPAMLKGLEKSLKPRWKGVLSKENMTASYQYGLDVLASEDGSGAAAAAVVDYIAKFGHEPKQRPEKNGWTITHELVKAGSKSSAGDGHYSMLELLDMYGNGDVKAGRLWKDYAIVMKGRNQLVWSRGLRDLLGIGEEKTDGELVDEVESNSDVRLAALLPSQWRAILRADMRGELLEMAANSSELDFNVWLADLLARWVPVST